MARELRGAASPPAGADPAPPWPADAWQGPLLALRVSSLGDVVLISGPLRLLHERRPELAIDVVTRARYAPALAGLGFLRRVRTIEEPLRGAGAEPPYATLLDWQGGPRGARAASLLAPGALQVRAQRAALARRLLVVTGGRLPRAVTPYALRLGRSVAGEAATLAKVAPIASAGADARALARERLDRIDRPQRGWAILAPEASRPLKAIPGPLAEEIASGLRARGFGVLRLEGPESGGEGGPAALRIEAGGPGIARASGDLEAVKGLIAESALFVGSDSGLLHLACGLDTPAVGIFGPTAPSLGFSPLGRARAAGVDLPCRPCHIHGPRRCWLGHERCWRDLSAEAVWRSAEEAFAEPPRGDRPGR